MGALGPWVQRAWAANDGRGDGAGHSWGAEVPEADGLVALVVGWLTVAAPRRARLDPTVTLLMWRLDVDNGSLIAKMFKEQGLPPTHVLYRNHPNPLQLFHIAM